MNKVTYVFTVILNHCVVKDCLEEKEESQKSNKLLLFIVFWLNLVRPAVLLWFTKEIDGMLLAFSMDIQIIMELVYYSPKIL